ncbi:hypothetical protein D915_009529 [Fasciola hepatica]|uniref:Pecanex-like protein n=1 Tax=Fasciola hepatica TaxID=6192 RepID=A0A4E0QZJ3_FASHE|nr:hypothetical protein D915_009529 [Fasciola hepatica]
MGFSMLAKIVREDVVSSLTGGFYLDYQQTHFVNITHLYLWILFFVSPLIFHLVCPESLLATVLYSTAIAAVVSLIKLVTWRLHRLLDLKEPVLEKHDSRLLLSEIPSVDWTEIRFRRQTELEEALKTNQNSLLPSRKEIVDSDDPFLNSYTPTFLEKKAGIELEQHFCRTTFGSCVAAAGTSRNRPVPLCNSQESNSRLLNEVSSDVEIVPSVDDKSHYGVCSESQETAEDPKKSVVTRTSYPPQSFHKIIRRRSPLSRRVPVRRQLSSTSALLYSTEPSNSANSVVGADLERCKRIICQLEADVNRLPVRSDEPFVPSLKDLDVLKRSQTRNPLVSTCGRSSSQRHHRAILASQIQAARQQAIHSPCSIFSRQTVGPAELTELSLADTILYWRRHFASSSARADNRTFRSQSFHQPNLMPNRLGRIGTDAVFNRHTGRRSHSLRYSHSVRNQLSAGCRHLPRRPGSALRLRTQQSVDSAFSSTRSNLISPDFIRPTSTGLPLRRTTMDSNDSSKEPHADSAGYQKRKTVILKVSSAESGSDAKKYYQGCFLSLSEFTSSKFCGIESPHQHSDTTPDLQKSTDGLDENGTANTTTRRSAELSNPMDDCAESRETECTYRKAAEAHSPCSVRRTGLVRQCGIRRKFIIVPTHKGDSVLESNTSEVMGHLSGTQSAVREQANAGANTNEEPQSDAISSSAATDPSPDKTGAVSTPHKPCASSSPTTKTIGKSSSSHSYLELSQDRLFWQSFP